MTGNLLEKYVGRSSDSSDSADESQGVVDDLGAFGWLRGVQERAVMLEIRHKDGRISAFGYAWLDQADFDPSDGITLHFSGKSLTIAGRNLNAEIRPNLRLFAGILRHRVPWIQEADGAALIEAAKDAIIIEEVKVT
jgi:hypothetical protein